MATRSISRRLQNVGWMLTGFYLGANTAYAGVDRLALTVTVFAGLVLLVLAFVALAMRGNNDGDG